jgi:flagellar hook assembly protein FlgD
MTATTSTTGRTGVANPYASLQMGTGTGVDKTSLGKDQFLNLLVTQMRYQDPSAPMDSSQIMAQTSSLATVEQLTELTTTQREAFALQMRLSASGFVGQTVTWTDAATKTVMSGTVDGASFADAVPVLVVGKTKVALDAVSLVKAAGTPAAPAAAPAAQESEATTKA